MPRRSLSRSGTFKAAPAPGNLRLFQAFVNTRDVEKQTDELTSPQALADWLADHRLLAAGASLDEAAWQQALELRETLRSQFRAHAGAALDEPPAKSLSRAFGEVSTRLTLRPGGKFRLEATEAGWRGVLGRLLVVYFEAERAGRWKRLKACRSDTCQWIFYDGSRNLAGKWCTVRRCGNWANTATYRGRGPVGRRR